LQNIRFVTEDEVREKLRTCPQHRKAAYVTIYTPYSLRTTLRSYNYIC
jgi:hypothetical protein